VHDREVRESARAGEYLAIEQRFHDSIEARRRAAEAAASLQEGGDATARAMSKAAFLSADEEVKQVRAEAVALVREVSGDRSYNDVNYVFPTWVMTHLPMGLVGLLTAAIFAAAMSTISAEFAALSTATVIDFYRRFGPGRTASDQQLLLVSRLATGGWAVFASLVAIWAVELGSLIEVVNRFGSLFYGSILGVFILALGWPRANGHGAFAGLLAGMAVIAYVSSRTPIGFLWHNLIAAVIVCVVGAVISELTGRGATASGDRTGG
jgi:Na+/proline symporter